MKSVAVIGLGNIATRHRNNLKKLFPFTTVLAMSSSGRIVAEDISDCDKLVTSVNEIISLKAELVIVASPAPYHSLHAVPLIEAGIPVLIEKPIASRLSDIESIQKAVDQYKTHVAVGYCLRYLPSTRKLRYLLKDNIIGTLYNAHIEIGQFLPDWRPSKSYRECVSANEALGGGALLELSHELDYAQWLLGDLKLHHAVLRSSEELKLKVEDIADITASTQNNGLVNIHLDFLQKRAYRSCSFVGSKGRIEWDLILNQLTFKTSSEVLELYKEPEWDKNQMYISMIEDFVCMINGKEHTCINLNEAKRSLELIEEIKLKAIRL